MEIINIVNKKFKQFKISNTGQELQNIIGLQSEVTGWYNNNHNKLLLPLR